MRQLLRTRATDCNCKYGRQATVRVEQVHINKGIKQSFGSCPIALAMEDAGLDDVIVTGFSALYKLGDSYFRANLSFDCLGFTIRFDAGKDVAPFDFEMHEEKYVTQS